MAQRTCTCVQCGLVFTQEIRPGGRPKRFCSRECRRIYTAVAKRRQSGRDQPRPCRGCGSMFIATGKGTHAYCPACGICALDDCDRKRTRGRYCAMHGDRVSKKGAPGSVEPLGPGPRPGLKPSIDVNGYERVHVGAGKLVGRHRLLMEQILGRPLEPFENVHHKNGVRHDNRPENLELWVKPQPPGQRPEDLVSWVVYHYPDLVASELQTRRRELRTGQVRLIV